VSSPEYKARIRADRQARVDAYKTGRGCAECGYNASPRALDLDHLDPAQKTTNVAQLVSWGASWKVIEAELRKCVVLCANCHRVKTFRDGDHLGKAA
jgi:5-methylcytosine-specific restriction endonuclease McrA